MHPFINTHFFILLFTQSWTHTFHSHAPTLTHSRHETTTLKNMYTHSLKYTTLKMKTQTTRLVH